MYKGRGAVADVRTHDRILVGTGIRLKERGRVERNRPPYMRTQVVPLCGKLDVSTPSNHCHVDGSAIRPRQADSRGARILHTLKLRIMSGTFDAHLGAIVGKLVAAPSRDIAPRPELARGSRRGRRSGSPSHIC